MSVYIQHSFLPASPKLVNLKYHCVAATRQSSQVHWCEHLSPMWTLAQMWHTGSGHMQAFHPSSLRSYWCCEYTSHACWLWQHSDSHNPSQKIGPSSLSPGQARPSLRKTLIDLMDLCAVHTPSPNKQPAQDLSPSRQRGSARPPLADRLRRRRRSAKLAGLTGGPRGSFEFAVRPFITRQITTLPTTTAPTVRSTGQDGLFIGRDQEKGLDFWCFCSKPKEDQILNCTVKAKRKHEIWVGF